MLSLRRADVLEDLRLREDDKWDAKMTNGKRGLQMGREDDKWDGKMTNK
jgi:hypothetical protein